MDILYTILSVLGASVIFPIIFIFILGGLRVINQYESGIVLTLGKYSRDITPGLTWIFLGIQRLIKVDMRITTVDIPAQEVITKDNVPLNINAVVYFKVDDSKKAILNISNYTVAVADFSQVALCDVIGGFELDHVLSEREVIADKIKEIVDKATAEWGVNIEAVKLQDIELPQDMKRIMAKQAESERERRSVIIRADGELEASKKLSEAAKVLSSVEGGLAMRTLQTIEKSTNSTIYALPVEILEGFRKLQK